ncbi:MAG: STAS domain-containing protein [Phycisphaerae bacterium]
MSIIDTLDIKISQSDRHVLITLVGSASMEHCDRLNESLLEACKLQPRLLVIDLSRLEFICSLGLGGFVVAYLRIQKYGGRIGLLCPMPAIRDMLATTKLGTLLPVYDTLDQAIAGT